MRQRLSGRAGMASGTGGLRAEAQVPMTSTENF